MNLYLKGFDQCANAKVALAANNLPRAQAAFAEYETIKRQAAGVDKSILTSSKREMDSNLKYCNRIGSDIELELGRPILEQGLAECDKAFDALKANQSDTAEQHFHQYVQQRDKALDVAPVINSVFSLKSDMRRCDRLENKITHAGEQQAVLVQLLDSAREESESFATYCTSTRKEFSDAGFGSQAIQAGEKAIAKIELYKKNAVDSYGVYTQKQSSGNAGVDAQLKKGEACLAAFRPEVAGQKRKYSALAADLKSQAGALATANNDCSSIGALSAQGPEQKRYVQATTQFESARKRRDAVKQALSANGIYSANPESAEVQDVNTRLASLNRCLDVARGQVSTLMPVVVAAPQPAKPVVVIPTKAPVATGIPAIKLKGVLKMTGVLPEFVMVYWLDGKREKDDGDVGIFSTGFSKRFYVLPDNGRIQIRNSDFSTHVLSVTSELLQLDKSLVSVASRQRRDAQVVMPQNAIAMLRSNNTRVAPSYVVNVGSSNIAVLNFAEDASVLDVELGNPNAARQGYLLAPDADPLAFELMSGETKTFNMTRNKAVVGTLTLQGL